MESPLIISAFCPAGNGAGGPASVSLGRQFIGTGAEKSAPAPNHHEPLSIISLAAVSGAVLTAPS